YRLGLFLRDGVTGVGTVTFYDPDTGVYGALLGYAASATNLSTHILARYAFGVFGSKLPSFMLAVTQIGWFGVGVAMFAYPINRLTGVCAAVRGTRHRARKVHLYVARRRAGT
ncbi:MAG: hypothetical protein EOM63_07185, partial [Clostridia bacterium]|nr:hypothetical protein [Clostridia bacterium]